jgi:hypothetical protein
MKIRFKDIVIDLPNDLNTEERIEFVNRIIIEHGDELAYQEKMFDTKYGKAIDTNKLIKVRLDILATYILIADPSYTKDIMSQYKIKMRPFQEIPFSQFPDEMLVIEGFN